MRLLYHNSYMYYVVSVNLGGMYAIISPVCDKWKDIGLKLGLFPATLEAIDKSYDGRNDQCLYSVLTKWLHRRDNVSMKGGSTWSALIQVLESVGADEDTLKTCRAEAIDPTDQTINVSSNQTSNVYIHKYLLHVHAYNYIIHTYRMKLITIIFVLLSKTPNDICT